jgi:hypothetical protein
MNTNIHFYHTSLSSSYNGFYFRQRCRENRNMRFIFKNSFSKIILFSVEKFVGPDRPQVKTHRTRIACWIPYATNTYSECVIIMTFPLQQWLHQHASLLGYT